MTSTTINIEKAAEMLKSHDNYTILCHANPDGDTVGCAHALCRALHKIGKNAKIRCADPFSKRFSYMWEGMDFGEFDEETIVSVDVADARLLGDLCDEYNGKVLLAIDHHVSHVDFQQFLCIEPQAAACAQTVYKVITAMGVPFDKDMAACLYTSIATDTGCFKFSSVTPETHIIAAELMKFDFDFAQINYVHFDLKTKERIAVEEQIYRDMKYFFDGRCAVVVLTKKVFDSVDSEDANGFADIPRRIEGVEVGVTIKEKGNGVWKVSMRSKGDVDVQKICSVFCGGGHKNAAGCSFEGMTADQIMDRMLPVIETYIG